MASGWTARIEQARKALAEQSWATAYEHLSRVPPSRLSAEDLEHLADAAWWVSNISESLAARQRAYAAWAEAGDNQRAALAAWRLATEYLMRGDGAVGTGWLRRAQRHLEGEPESVVDGYLALSTAEHHHAEGDLPGAIREGERAAQIARRFADRELLALAIETQGRFHIAQGRVREGSALLDEAMTSVIAGELSPYVTGWIYCQVIYACLELADLGRASEWNEAAVAWCRSLPPGGLAGTMCELNRAEVVSLRGELAVAEAEARRVAERFMALGEHLMAAEAFYATGEYRRRMGDLGGAEEAFARADQLGRDPQPGLALLRLAQGRVKAGLTALRLFLDAQPANRLRRSRVLAAQVEVALAAHDIEVARSASHELDAIAEEFRSPALIAMAAMGRGLVELAEGDPSRALADLRQAWALWEELKVPYEAARARRAMGLARLRASDAEGARRDMEAARDGFERLGAVLDARRTRDMLVRRALPGGLSEREAQVLRLVAAGQSNREVADALFISEHTVARHLQNIFSKIGVSSRAAAAAFAGEHGLVPGHDGQT